MNFDNLKEAWRSDTDEDRSLSFHEVSIKNPVPVIGKVRKNMKRGLTVLCSFYLFLLFLFFLWFKTRFTMPLFILVAMILYVQTIYYVVRFYRFYKSIGKTDVNMKESIRHTILDLELNIGMYKSYVFSALPLVALLLLLVFAGKGISAYFQELISGIGSTSALFIFIVFVLIFQIVVFFPVDQHICHHYGRYLKELKKIWEDLETEDKAIK